MRHTLLLTVLAAAVTGLNASAPAADQPIGAAKAEKMQADALAAIAALKGHVTGTAKLTDEQIAPLTKTIESDAAVFGHDETIIKAALDLVSTFETKMGPLWVSHPPFNQRGKPKGIAWAVFHVMQNIMDHVYTPGNVAKYGNLLDGYKFQCSANFPGSVAPRPTRTRRMR